MLDPGIGFFREKGAGMAYSRQELMPWYEWDGAVLSGLSRLRVLGRPLCVGLSRKSFLGKILGAPGSTSVRTSFGNFYTAIDALSIGVLAAKIPG